MDLYEYQGRELLARHGLPVLDGEVAETPERAREIAQRLGGRVVVKAQVKVGGRGKAGGIKLARDAEEAGHEAASILGMDIGGHRVGRVMVTETADIAEEYYLSFLMDRAERRFLCISSVAGGMDIEQVARATPDQVARVSLDPATGVDDALATEIIGRAGWPAGVADQAARVVTGLWEAFVAEDATLVEVNPLARTTDGRLLCLDAKVSLDDNATFRHPDHAAWQGIYATDTLERAAQAKDLNYVRLDGAVGVIGNGAGLVMSTLDVVAYAGEAYGGVRPANFLDIGGGASAQVMADSLEIVLSDPSVRSVLINVFGGITSCDEVAKGIVSALNLLRDRGEAPDRPIVVRLDGNNAAQGRAILDSAASPLVRRVDTMDGAARKAAELAAGSAPAPGAPAAAAPAGSAPAGSAPAAGAPAAAAPVTYGAGV